MTLTKQQDALATKLRDAGAALDKPPPWPVCRYCGKPDKTWASADLKAGRRNVAGGIEYHCYAGYCID